MAAVCLPSSLVQVSQRKKEKEAKPQRERKRENPQRMSAGHPNVRVINAHLDKKQIFLNRVEVEDINCLSNHGTFVLYFCVPFLHFY